MAAVTVVGNRHSRRVPSLSASMTAQRHSNSSSSDDSTATLDSHFDTGVHETKRQNARANLPEPIKFPVPLCLWGFGALWQG